MAPPAGSARTGAGQSSFMLALVHRIGSGVGPGVAVGVALGVAPGVSLGTATAAGALGLGLGLVVGCGPAIEGWPRWNRKYAPPSATTATTSAAANVVRDMGGVFRAGHQARR